MDDGNYSNFPNNTLPTMVDHLNDFVHLFHLKITNIYTISGHLYTPIDLCPKYVVNDYNITHNITNTPPGHIASNSDYNLKITQKLLYMITITPYYDQLYREGYSTFSIKTLGEGYSMYQFRSPIRNKGWDLTQNEIGTNKHKTIFKNIDITILMDFFMKKIIHAYLVRNLHCNANS